MSYKRCLFSIFFIFMVFELVFWLRMPYFPFLLTCANNLWLKFYFYFRIHISHHLCVGKRYGIGGEHNQNWDTMPASFNCLNNWTPVVCRDDSVGRCFTWKIFYERWKMKYDFIDKWMNNDIFYIFKLNNVVRQVILNAIKLFAFGKGIKFRS